jgi:hypothetical protein
MPDQRNISEDADSPERIPADDRVIRIVRGGRHPIVVGSDQAVDIVAAIKAGREDRDGEIARRILGDSFDSSERSPESRI